MRTPGAGLLLGAMSMAVLAGCSSLSGYDAKDSFTCKAPDGVMCSSMTGIDANAQQDNLPGQRLHSPGGVARRDPSGSETIREAAMTRPIHSGTPIRSTPRILRVWFAPWEDSDGDLHDQSYVYLPVDTGKWQVEHNRRRIQDAYRPVRPPVASVSHSQGAVQSGNGQSDAAASSVVPLTPISPQVAAEVMDVVRARAARATSSID